MSERYPGGFMTQSPPTPSASNTTGVWTLDQQQQLQQAGQWPANGPFWIEDVFQTWLYTGNGGTQTITNGVDLAGKGGLIWTKARSAANRHALVDTVQGGGWELASNLTNGQNAISPATTFGAAGYTMNDSATSFNSNGVTYASWTFRKQPKFFDVVTWTGNGALSSRLIAHNLGSVPGSIIVKRTDTTSDWIVAHRSSTFPLILNSTNGASSANRNNGYPDLSLTNATQFAVSDGASGVSAVNANGGTYVAYLFAHDAGGFGLTGTDNVISCGSFTTDASGNATVNLGYEPQWLLTKTTSTTSPWRIVDNMRGFSVGADSDAILEANTSNAESPTQNLANPTATGFLVTNVNTNTTFIYIAIRRGPMRTPTTGTSVYQPVTYTGTSANQTITAGFPVDLSIIGNRSVGTIGQFAIDRLRGAARTLNTTTSQAEFSDTTGLTSFASNTAITLGSSANGYVNDSGRTYIDWNFRRAPGFFDEVCYTGNSSVMTINHNLGVIPELMIFKNREAARRWPVYTQPTGNTQALILNETGAVNSTGNNYFNSTSPTSTTFTVNASFADIGGVNTMVAYLFASCPGVSKVGSYTGTGTTQVINCGFTGGARFVLIKRSDSTGDWYVWDTARGMIPANDPYLLLNSTAAEVTGTDFVDTAATGFEISSTAPAAINANGGTFIFLAIA